MKTKLSVLIVVVIFLSSCTKEYIVDDIAQRLNISATLDGNPLKIGDTIVVNQFKNPYPSIEWNVDGLQEGEYLELFCKFGQREEIPFVISEEYFANFSGDGNRISFRGILDPSEYSEIYNEKDMKVSFRFKTSDGSEKWINYPLKVQVDSSLYKSKIWISDSSYGDIPSEIILEKGEGLNLIVWMETNLVAGEYLRVVSTNYINNNWHSTGVLTGYENKPIDSNTMRVFVPYELKFNRRKVEFQLMGRYANSNIETVTINWKWNNNV